MRAAIVTGADHGYFPLMRALLWTLAHRSGPSAFDLLVLDFGLQPDEIAAIEALNAKVVRPTWWFDAPKALRSQRHLSYAARPMIPSYFPGYDLYLWLDADISIDDAGFTAAFLRAAETGDLAIAEEKDEAYRTELYALKWRIGNAFRCFGLRDGLRLSLARPINSGAFALRADAPHWALWQRRYRDAVMRAGRVNLDQHALGAAITLDGLQVNYLESTHNWICARSQPLWDDDRRVFCRPLPPYQPIHVLHLAGRQKSGLRDIRTLGGGVRSMPLAYLGASESDPVTDAVVA